MSHFEVAIVGAGAAGLAAANHLISSGKSVVVLEAMDRIGGRAWTTEDWFDVPFDVGCAWLHAADRNPFYSEAVAAGTTLFHHDMNLDHLYFGARTATPEELAEVCTVDAALAALIESNDETDDRLSSLLGKGHVRRAVATFFGPMDFGQDADEISVADFRAAANLDPNYFTKEGFGSLVAAFGANVPVRTGCPVRQIDWSGSDVVLSGDWGSLHVDDVIVTVSPGVLAFEDIRFVPALPPAHLEAAFDLPMGLLTKIPLEISGTRLGLAPFDDLLIERHARHDIFFLCFPFDTDLMVGFVGGDFAWEIEAAGEAAAVDFATDRLADIFGTDLRRAVGRGRMTNWAGERTVRGAYAAARPGKAGARGVLAQSIADRVHFAGEHLAGSLMQTCGGARLSGEAVARRILERRSRQA